MGLGEMGLGEMLPNQETTYAKSNDVTWPQKVKLVTPKSLKPRISVSVQDRCMVIIHHQ